MAEDKAPAPAASETSKPSAAEKVAAAAEADFLRRAALAEEDAETIEADRRAALAAVELANYERAHGAPIVKGE